MGKFITAIVFVLLFFSCTRQKQVKKPLTFNPVVIEANGYVVPNDSMASPAITPAGKPEILVTGKPAIVYTNTNERPVGKPKIILAGTGRSITPGQDTFLLPKSVTAIENPIIAGEPEVVIARDAYINDQNPQNFSTFSKRQGLKYSSVNCQLQDSSGNIWFGTYGGGVTKYDGKSFTHFTEKEGLTNNRVWSILQDHKGNLWFGTDDGGVSKYDGKSFTNFTTKEGLCDNTVLFILQDKNENFWFATGAGVSKYDGKSFTHFTEKEGLSYNSVLSVSEDKNGNLWFGTGGGGVSRYDGKSFTHYTEKEGLINNYVLTILQDTNGNIWFGTLGGISKFDGKYFTNFTEEEGLSNNKVYSILQDNNGALWIGTDGGGVSKLMLKENSDYSLNSNSSDLGSVTHFTVNEGLINNIVYSILRDKNDNLWFGTNGGVSKYGGKLFTHFTRKEGLTNNKVYSILKDKKGNLWFGTFGGGVSKYDGKSFTHFTTKEGLGNNNVFSIFEDDKGNLWFGTDGGGVSKYDGHTFTHFTKKEGLSNNKVYSVLQDKAGNLWFGTYGGGVSKFDGKYFTNFTEKEGLCNNYVLSIFQDTDDNIWFGTDGGGVSKLLGSDPGGNNNSTVSKTSSRYQFINFTKKEGLGSDYVLCILQDKNEDIWFGTGGGGVSKYDGKYFTHFTEADGLSNDYVLSIFQDKSDNLWFGTRFGLCRLNTGNIKLKAKNPQLPLFIDYEYEDGFLGIGCTRGAICQDNTGIIWIGTNDRLTAYHPEGDMPDTIPPNIQLTGISLFNEKINWSDLLSSTPTGVNTFKERDTSIVLGNGVIVSDFNFNEISRWYGIPQNLKLKYNNNDLTFTFIGITQKQSKGVRYQYKLEGFDENWSAPALRNEASYGNLAPGEYTFKIKAVNSEGLWSREFTYSFTINHPWWKTAWFRICFAIFIIVFLFIFFRWRIASLIKNQKKLEYIVKEKTADAVRQAELLKTTNEELLLQKEALEVAIATKDKFFSIIAHDLRSPLSGFLGLSQVMAEELPSLTMKQVQDFAISMSKSANDLYRLLENLLEWSKIQKGAISFNPVLVQLDLVAGGGVDAIREQAGSKEIEISVDIAVGLQVFADRNMLQTILRNLLSNAVKFTPKGGKVHLSAKAAPDNCIEISIHDTGIGMSQTMIASLFRIDVLSNRKGTDGEKSTGLGLLLCKEFIERHGGKIRIESEVGKGTEFKFTLPFSAGHNDVNVIENNGTSEVKDNNYSCRKILITDDDHASGKLLGISVKLIAKEIIYAKNGLEAVKACKENPDIDVILMDIRMPVMDGFEATKQIRHFNKEVIIIMQTAFSESIEKEKAKEAGCNDFITKPINRSLLTELIKNHLLLNKRTDTSEL